MRVVIFGSDLVGIRQFTDYLTETGVPIDVVADERAAALNAQLLVTASVEHYTVLVLNSAARPALPKDVWLQLLDQMVINDSTRPLRWLLSRDVCYCHLGYIINTVGAAAIVNNGPDVSGPDVNGSVINTILADEVLVYDPTIASSITGSGNVATVNAANHIDSNNSFNPFKNPSLQTDFFYLWLAATLLLLIVAVICLIIWGIAKLVAKSKSSCQTDCKIQRSQSTCHSTTGTYHDIGQQPRLLTFTREAAIQTDNKAAEVVGDCIETGNCSSNIVTSATTTTTTPMAAVGSTTLPVDLSTCPPAVYQHLQVPVVTVPTAAAATTMTPVVDPPPSYSYVMLPSPSAPPLAAAATTTAITSSYINQEVAALPWQTFSLPWRQLSIIASGNSDYQSWLCGDLQSRLFVASHKSYW